MYEYISGMITKINPKYVVLDHNGIGYLIYVPNPYNWHVNDFCTIYVYQAVREDSIDLYGFQSSDEKDLFLKLISVTGIGPKSALPILAASTPNEIKENIASGNSSYMQKFPGIGPKAAQQIILDLRGKIEFDTVTLIKDDLDDCIEALVALGYNKKEVSKVMSKVDTSLAQNEIIKQALKLLSKL